MTMERNLAFPWYGDVASGFQQNLEALSLPTCWATATAHMATRWVAVVSQGSKHTMDTHKKQVWTPLQHTMRDFFQRFSEVGNHCRTSVARVLDSHDYRLLAQRLGLCFLGCVTPDNLVAAARKPLTSFCPHAVFSSTLREIADLASLDALRERDPSLLVDSYMSLHFELIQRQPTTERVKQVLHDHPDLSHDALREYFPGAVQKVLEHVHSAVLAAVPQEDDTKDRCEAEIEQLHLSPEGQSGQDETEEWHRKTAPKMSGEAHLRMRELKARQMQKQLDSMTHPTPPSKQGAPPRTQSFQTMPLSYEAKKGFDIARARGLRLLVDAYRTRLQEEGEQRCRLEERDRILNLQTGEGVTQMRKYEPLRLSPILLDILKRGLTTAGSASYVSSLGDACVQDLVWAALEKYRDAVATLLEARTTEDATRQVSDLTHHETVLGAVACLLQRSGTTTLEWRCRTRLRCMAKGSSSVTDVHLLRIFAVASFVEMVEGSCSNVCACKNPGVNGTFSFGEIWSRKHTLRFCFTFVNNLALSCLFAPSFSHADPFAQRNETGKPYRVLLGRM